MPNYGDKKYWEQRYLEQKEITFDWQLIITSRLEDYSTLKSIIEEFKLDKKGCKTIVGNVKDIKYENNFFDLAVINRQLMLCYAEIFLF